MNVDLWSCGFICVWNNRYYFRICMLLYMLFQSLLWLSHFFRAWIYWSTSQLIKPASGAGFIKRLISLQRRLSRFITGLIFSDQNRCLKHLSSIHSNRTCVIWYLCFQNLYDMMPTFLAEKLGDVWTPPVQEAWTAVVGIMSSVTDAAIDEDPNKKF